MASVSDDKDVISDYYGESDSPENASDKGEESEFALHLSSSEESDSDESEGESESDEAPSEFIDDGFWKMHENIVPSPKLDFLGPLPGPRVNVDKEFREIDFFKLFFTDEIINILVKQTNTYAEQTQARNGPDKTWTPVTFEDMRAWLGVRMFMSLVRLSDADRYWSEDYLLGGHQVRHVMRRDRYCKIAQYLHAADDSTRTAAGQPGHDRLHEVRQVWDMVKSNCVKNYHPHQNVYIAEAMTGFHGGMLGGRHFMPPKSIQRQMKMWMRIDTMNGYINDFQFYAGKEDRQGTRLVLDLMSRVINLQHIVNCDDDLMSPELCRDLLKVGTYARGPVKTCTRGFPRTILHPRHVKAQGDMLCAQKGEIVAVAWKNKQLVNMLSTAENPADIKDAWARKHRDGSVTHLPCPTILKHFQDHTDRVARSEQLRTELSTYRASKSRWQYLFWFVFDVSVYNAFVMMSESCSHQQKSKSNKVKPLTVLQFRMALTKQLIGEYQCTRKRKRVSNQDEGGFAHWPKMIPKRARCRRCSKNGKRRDVRIKCGACDVGLCVDCFEPYHTALFLGC